MPQMDGLAMLEALQADPQLKCIPVVMLTAKSDTHNHRRAEQLGAKAYLIKASHSVAEVLENVRNYTDRAESGAGSVLTGRSFRVSANRAFSRMRFQSGTHRAAESRALPVMHKRFASGRSPVAARLHHRLAAHFTKYVIE